MESKIIRHSEDGKSLEVTVVAETLIVFITFLHVYHRVCSCRAADKVGIWRLGGYFFLTLADITGKTSSFEVINIVRHHQPHLYYELVDLTLVSSTSKEATD